MYRRGVSSYRRGVSSRTRKLVIVGAAAALLGSALAVGTGMSQAAETGDVNALVPALGFSPGDPNATADRVGPTGVNVPGRCPPTQAQVNAQVALKNGSLPTGTDLESRIQRYEKTLSAIQDLKCPASSTTLLGRLKSLTALRGNANSDAALRGLGLNETPADRAAAPGPGDAAAGGSTGNAGAGSADINALVPALGFSPGDPNATADRVGPTGINVPGRCPPTQAQVNAQVALKNGSLPTGTDLESRIQRYEKTLSAIQDLKCPASSTTLLGRLKSLTALRGNANSDDALRGLGLNETPAG
ncbi:hypothetical protein KOI35_41040 [Actinoplanes bogorensis]|uniref:Secreted protein n=1 Tax=Paractinoplanes bogorensis TaxID=1610840 RepID=A0ABS5Z2N5_9ACTN|nr:hypothetical protein [Actinoplanes bogorensis]MBU2669917.1 hypothetical protein [Actinoplanes bogorensis]